MAADTFHSPNAAMTSPPPNVETRDKRYPQLWNPAANTNSSFYLSQRRNVEANYCRSSLVTRNVDATANVPEPNQEKGRREPVPIRNTRSAALAWYPYRYLTAPPHSCRTCDGAGRQRAHRLRTP